MACSSCGSQIATSAPLKIPVVCSVTKAEYQAMLFTLEATLTANPNYLLYRQTLVSQINIYDSNCGVFQNYILTNIKPLV